MGAPFFAFFAKGGHDADGSKSFSLLEFKKSEEEDWSGRADLNRGPPAPKAGALPGCATPRPLNYK